jgi:hypothetical protein
MVGLLYQFRRWRVRLRFAILRRERTKGKRG